jgi:hypothetical protein
VSTIDGRPERTTVRRQTAADLLRLVGLDPARYDLSQLHDHGHDHEPTRFCDDEIIDIHQRTAPRRHPRADRSARSHHDRPPARLTYADARNAADADAPARMLDYLAE